MVPRYVLGIDNGGTFTKAAIYDADGSIIALDQAHLDTLTPKPCSPNATSKSSGRPTSGRSAAAWRPPASTPRRSPPSR